jgi:DNA end-binding protein Ku
MRFQDEVVSGRDVEVPSPAKKPGKGELQMAKSLVSALETRFDPERHKDTFRDSVLDLIRQKASGKEVELPPPEPELAPDMLSAALEASLQGNGAGKTRKTAKAAR